MDSIREQQWHLDAMHAPDIWKSTTGTGVTVAVVDTGFKADAPDLEGQLLPGTDLSGLPGGVFVDPIGHGTSMATDIAGTGKGLNGKGAYGLAPGAKILPIKVNSKMGGTDGTAASAMEELANGISYGADHGAKVISVSQGIAAGYLTAADLAKLKSAVDHALSRGSLVFAAVGNSGDSNNVAEYPAAMPGVVGVAAADKEGKSTAESEHGPQVALTAPGADIYTACTASSGYCKNHGTSEATALASASAALVWSAHPDWTNNQVLRVLINTASSPQQRSDYIGYGAVRPRIALTTPGDPGPADVFPLKQASAPSGAATTPGGSAPSQAASAPAGGTQSSAPAASSSSSGISPAMIIGGVVLLLLVLVVVIVLVSRRNRTTPPPAAPMPGGFPGQQQPAYQQQPYQGGFPGQQPPQAPYGQQPPAPGGFPPPQGTPPAGGNNNPYAR
ncbi:type VII secretion-associated serine protease mycosin [Kitasatospora sp. NPDC059571]|uniref:type VII secretion-associated serine protease mycosin n=1 Tax=Kitasatospora sp. NPDC059571 TaxID=3346871 RepID=UPI003677DDB1